MVDCSYTSCPISFAPVVTFHPPPKWQDSQRKEKTGKIYHCNGTFNLLHFQPMTSQFNFRLIFWSSVLLISWKLKPPYSINHTGCLRNIAIPKTTRSYNRVIGVIVEGSNYHCVTYVIGVESRKKLIWSRLKIWKFEKNWGQKCRCAPHPQPRLILVATGNQDHICGLRVDSWSPLITMGSKSLWNDICLFF